MTDVVAIAQKCRDELSAEIARLDEFIRMAEKLRRYEELAANSGDEDTVELTPSLAAASAAASANGTGASAKP